MIQTLINPPLRVGSFIYIILRSFYLIYDNYVYLAREIKTHTLMKKLLVLALCLFTIQGLSAQEEEMKPQKFTNVDYFQVVYVKFLPGKIERAKEIISKFESAGEGIMEAPQTHWFMTGEYDAMFVWHMKDGPAELEWKYSEEGIQWYQAFIKQEGSAEAAQKLNEEYVSLISYSNSALSMKER